MAQWIEKFAETNETLQQVKAQRARRLATLQEIPVCELTYQQYREIFELVPNQISKRLRWQGLTEEERAEIHQQSLDACEDMARFELEAHRDKQTQTQLKDVL